MNILKSMKTGLFGMCIAASLAAKPASADVLEYTLTGADLDHEWALSWGITSPEIPQHLVLSATLTIDNIRDWQIESDDMLYIGLLGSASTGLRYFYDDEVQPDYFAGSNLPLVTFSDLLPYSQADVDNLATVDLVYNFSAEQVAFLNANAFAGGDGNFGLTMDPDCHYYTDGIKLTFVTQPVPEPGTLALLGTGLLVLGLGVRRRKHA